MVKLFIKFPKVENNTIFDGTRHEAEAKDIVQVENSNVYILEFIDNKLNKRSRILLQKGAREISHMPLYVKTGLNDLFDKYKKTSPVIDLESFFANDKDIGATRPYANLDSFLEDLYSATKKMAQVKDQDEFYFGSEKPLELGPQAVYVVDDYETQVAGMAAEAANYTPEPKEETKVDRGVLGFYGATKTAVGPGRVPDSWERLGVPIIDDDDYQHGPNGTPPPGGHGPRR